MSHSTTTFLELLDEARDRWIAPSLDSGLVDGQLEWRFDHERNQLPDAALPHGAAFSFAVGDKARRA